MQEAMCLRDLTPKAGGVSAVEPHPHLRSLGSGLQKEMHLVTTPIMHPLCIFGYLSLTAVIGKSFNFGINNRIITV